MKIVIGYDGSNAANESLKNLANAGLPPGAQVRIVRAVVPLLPLESLAPVGDGITWYADAYKDAVANHEKTVAHAKMQAQDAVKLLKGMFPSWKITTVVTEEVPAKAILEAAEIWKADLIIVGSSGWNEITKVVIGSVADKVLSHAHCTVRLAKKGAGYKPHAPKLLIAFDGSAYALEAVRQISSRSWPKGTEARILAVSEFQLRMGDITLALAKTMGTKKGPASPWPWMDMKLAKAVVTLQKAGIKADAALIIDEPRRAILSQARKFKADTIVMGTHGLTGLKRFLLGSVSASVAAHAPCTVEVVRGKPHA